MTCRTSFKDFVKSNNPHPTAVRNFQRDITQQFKDFLRLIVQHAFAICGPAPCKYDIRLMGSFGREEPCSFSDLELMILIQQESHRDFFVKLAECLTILLASLGEDPQIGLVFTCIMTEKPKGLHIDTGLNPYKNIKLIGTPDELATLAMSDEGNPGSPGHVVRRSISLENNYNSSGATLFDQFERQIKQSLDLPIDKPIRFVKAQELIRERIDHNVFEGDGFKQVWKEPIQFDATLNLKKQYTQLLNLLLADLAHCWRIAATNSIDIIDALIKTTALSEASGELIKEAVSSIYFIRIRIHDKCGKQDEECFNCDDFTLSSQQALKQLEKAEQQLLTNIYWLIIHPLYHCLETVLEIPQINSLPQHYLRDHQELGFTARYFSKVDILQYAFDLSLQRWETYIHSAKALESVKDRLIYIQSTLMVYCVNDLNNIKHIISSNTIQEEILILLQQRQKEYSSKLPRHISLSKEFFAKTLIYYRTLKQEAQLVWFLNLLRTDFIFYWIEPECLFAFLRKITFTPDTVGWRLARDLELVDFCKQVRVIVDDKESEDSLKVSIKCRNLENPFTNVPCLYYLKKCYREQIFDDRGFFKADLHQQTVPTVHSVFSIKDNHEIKIWEKFCPENAAYELLAWEISWILGRGGIPPSLAVNLTIGDRSIAILLSQHVMGERLIEERTVNTLKNLSQVSFTESLIRALLTKPEDDKPEDYFVCKMGREIILTRIDNERLFCKTIDKTKMSWILDDTVNLKSVLFFLDQMNSPLDTLTIQNFITKSPRDISKKLLGYLKDIHSLFNSLYDETMVKSHFLPQNLARVWNIRVSSMSLLTVFITKFWTKKLIVNLNFIHWACTRCTAESTGFHLLEVTRTFVCGWTS